MTEGGKGLMDERQTLGDLIWQHGVFGPHVFSPFYGSSSEGCSSAAVGHRISSGSTVDSGPCGSSADSGCISSGSTVALTKSASNTSGIVDGIVVRELRHWQ